MYNVKEFNARGDGQTDDTGAIQKAVDAGRASAVLQCHSTDNHGVVFLGQGAPGKSLADNAIRHLDIQQMVANRSPEACLLYVKFVQHFQAESLRLSWEARPRM